MPLIEANDAQISYDVTGEGEPLLMIMGFAADARMWMMQTPAFSQRYRCITLDNRGVGSSTSGPGTFDLATMAADARMVLDELGIERAHVLGISMGGAIAQHLALDAPDRVRSLLLAATWCAPNPYTTRMAALGLRIYDELGPRAFVQTSMLWLFSPRFLIEHGEMADAIETMFSELLPSREAMLAQLEALLVHDTRARLGAIAVPTLVMVGRRDILVPPELSEQIAAEVPGSELAYLQTAHAFNVEEADTFNATVLGFLEKR